MYSLRPRGASLTCGATSARLPDGPWNSWISLSSWVTWGSDGPTNALLSSLSLFTNLALSSHQSWLPPPSFVSWRSLNARLAWAAGQPNWALPAMFSLHPLGSWRSVLPRSSWYSPQTRGPWLTQSSPRTGKSSVSSLALDASESEYALYTVLTVPARSPIFPRCSPHSLESPGPGAARVASLPGRSGWPRSAKVPNPANPAWVSPGAWLALVTNISLRSHQSHLARIPHTALSPHQAGYSPGPWLSVLPILTRLPSLTRFPSWSHQAGSTRESSETHETCGTRNSDVSIRTFRTEGTSLA